jgi:Holliday junction resolvase-like predicted endonuclease
LHRKGFWVIARNYHSRWGELDLIAVKSKEDGFVGEMYFDEEIQEMKDDATLLQGNSIHFVEVKTRTGTTYGTPGAAVSYVKQQKIRKTALLWLQEQEECYSAICFDVIEVWVVGGTAKIRWLQNCF